ncbi:hypothetical protein TNCV_3806781 [Trichonephila clavipes]|nr:hypothetical protein TNCV_3806781 [Trichonephila clavipes]
MPKMTCEILFGQFFPLKDEGRPSDVSDEMLPEMIRTNPKLTFTEMGFKLGIHQTTALNYIKRLSFMFKLSECQTNSMKKNLNDRISDMFFKSCSSPKGTFFGLLGDWR